MIEKITASYMETYSKVRKMTLEICKNLQTEDFVVQPITDVSPPKWHMAHTTWFFETFILIPYKKGYRLFDNRYGYLFNSYYESFGNRVQRMDRGNLTRPEVIDIIRYRLHVDQEINEFLKEEDSLDPSIINLIELGIQHEQQHQELLITDIKYILGNNPLFPVYKNKIINNPKNRISLPENYLQIEEGIYEIGYNENDFCFDNEKGNHKVFLHAFQLMDRLITNEEYIEFINDKGYQNFNYWLLEGWEWVKQNKIDAPLYWHWENNQWHYYTLGGYQPVNMNDPVCHISFYEADAFSKWRGKRLLTEFEWEIACKHFNNKIITQANFLEARNFHPQVAEKNNNQLLGDVWEWTNSAYLPYPYYTKPEGAWGEYNGKFMINQMVLRGGSCATPANHIRSTYRNFFHPDKRWQFTGIRLGESL